MGVRFKGFSAFIFIFLLSPGSFALTCGQLLSQPISYDSFMQESVPQEQVLKTYLDSFKREPLSTETKLNVMINVLQYYYDVGRQIRRVEPDIYEIPFSSKKFTERNQRRYRDSVDGLETLIKEVLTERGINFRVVHNTILISRSGDHYMNQVASRLYSDGKLEMGFNVHNLLRYTAGGIFFDGNTKRINLPLRALQEKSFFQENVSLHEFTHYKDHAESQALYRPYYARIDIKVLDHGAFDIATIYRKGFSVDEIKAYRTTLRVIAHEALTTQSKTNFKENYKKLQRYLEMEIEFSRITKMVFEKYLDGAKDGTLAKSRTVTIPGIAEFTINEVAAKPENAKQTLTMATFTHRMFTLMALELNKHEEGTYEQRRAAVQRVNAILSKPEVRKLQGNYPSILSIAEALRD